MRGSILALGLCLASAPAWSQQSLLTASPIPEGAESRFCYYAGMAYSKSAYILITGGGAAAQAVGTTGDGAVGLGAGGNARARERTQALRCVDGDDGGLVWAPVATIQVQ